MKTELKSRNATAKAIEENSFAFEFISKIATKESWRKEVFRPIYHVHKWWAKRLGSVFRGIVLGSVLPKGTELEEEFYKCHSLTDKHIFDPFTAGLHSPAGPTPMTAGH